MQTEMIKALMGAAGAGGDGTYIDEIFSNYIYHGVNGSDITVTNGIDISNEGALVWIKNRTDTKWHVLADTERGATKSLATNSNNAQVTSSTRIKSFSSSGFTVGQLDEVNEMNRSYASWTFRKEPGFFDIVTYTGNGTAGRQIAHGLGSTPGAIIVKRTSNTEDWIVYHRAITSSNPEEHYLTLNSSDSKYTGASAWNDTAPTSTHFTVGNGNSANTNGETYVAYLFAHDDQSFGKGGNNSVIKCGSYVGNGSDTVDIDVNLGWEPTWLLVKQTVNSGNWQLVDSAAHWPVSGNWETIRPNNNQAAYFATETGIQLTPTGFKIVKNWGNFNTNGDTHVFIAIRRSDGYVGKPPDAGTDVFNIVYGDTGDGTISTEPSFEPTNFAVDMGLIRAPNSTQDWPISTRLTSGLQLLTNTTGAESTNSNAQFDYASGWNAYDGNNTSNISWMWKRHAGFDVQRYTGQTGQQSREHLLNAVPEMIWAKSTNNAYNWAIGHKDLTGGWTSKHLRFTTSAEITGQQFALAPTRTHWTTPNGALVNDNGEEYIAMFFASVNGISKVGSFDGQDSTITITTGFQPRFLIVKRITGVDGWLVFDTVRGWGSGNDYRLMLDSDATQSAPVDYGAPTSTGFTLTTRDSTNANGEKYIYYAHS